MSNASLTSSSKRRLHLSSILLLQFVFQCSVLLEGKMAGTPRLRKREDPEAWVVDVFDLELDEASRAEIAADPSGFFRSLIESEGIPVNGLMIDDKMLNGEEQELGVIVTAHIRSPRELKSHVMTTIIKGV